MSILCHLILAVARKNPPQMIGGIKKLERSGVWVAHCSFASGRPNEMVCGLHTVSFVSGRSNEAMCGLHTTSLGSGTMLQEGRATKALLPTCGFSLSSGKGHLALAVFRCFSCPSAS